MKKLTKQETVALFKKLAEDHCVLDYYKSGGGHERFYLGKEAGCKPVFLACSRVGWICVYFDANEKGFITNNDCLCEPVISKDERYDYRTRISVECFDAFLNNVQLYLGRANNGS